MQPRRGRERPGCPGTSDGGDPFAAISARSQCTTSTADSGRSGAPAARSRSRVPPRCCAVAGLMLPRGIRRHRRLRCRARRCAVRAAAAVRVSVRAAAARDGSGGSFGLTRALDHPDVAQVRVPARKGSCRWLIAEQADGQRPRDSGSRTGCRARALAASPLAFLALIKTHGSDTSLIGPAAPVPRSPTVHRIPLELSNYSRRKRSPATWTTPHLSSR